MGLVSLTLENISKSFRHQDGSCLLVLDSVSLQVQCGEIVCLLGPSGCGKTTLLNIIAGLDHVDSGQVLIKNSDSVEPRIGYMFQTDGLLAWRTVEKNVVFGLELRNGGETVSGNSRTEALLNEFGLGRFAKSYPSQLSGGMRQRVALARTLLIRPEILLLDEPLAHLDALSRIQIGAFLRQYVASEAASAVIVSHSIEDAISIGDRVLVLGSNPACILAEFMTERVRSLDSARIEKSLISEVEATLQARGR